MGLHSRGLEAASEGAQQHHNNLASDLLCSKPAVGSFGVLAAAGCSIASGALSSHHGSSRGKAHSLASLETLLPRGGSKHGPTHQHWPLLHSSGGLKKSRHAERSFGFFDLGDGSARDTVFLDVKVGSLTSSPPGPSEQEQQEEAVEQAQHATAEASTAQKHIEVTVETAVEACDTALSAAEVGLYTQVIALMGTTAGMFTSWLGWKLHDSQLPKEFKVPDAGNVLPPELLRPPPNQRVSTAFRQGAATARAAP